MKKEMEKKCEDAGSPIENESYSTEVQELMGKIPPVILRLGITFIFILIVVSLFLCSITKVPLTTKFSLKLSNVNVLKEVKTERSGYIVGNVPAKRIVHRGDTLLLLVDRYGVVGDTICIRTPISGIAYACIPFTREDFVEKGASLFFIVDSIKNKIEGIGCINIEQKHLMGEIMKVETHLNGQILQGKVVSIARYVNPLNDTYAVKLEFDYPKEMETELVWNSHAEGKVTFKGQTVMKNLFPLLRMIKNETR